MKLAKIIATIFLGAALNGCAIKNFESDFENTNFVVSETTKLNVYQVLGQPHSVDESNDSEIGIWYYFNGDVFMNPITLIPYAGLLLGGVDIDFTITALSFSTKNDLLFDISDFQVKRYVNHWAKKEHITRSEEANKNVKVEVEKLGFEFNNKIAKKMRYYHAFLPSKTQSTSTDKKKKD